jgi:hypothetical protein
LGHSRPVTGLLYLYLNFLEPFGPLQACNGTALPLLLVFNNVFAPEGRFHCLLNATFLTVLPAPAADIHNIKCIDCVVKTFIWLRTILCSFTELRAVGNEYHKTYNLMAHTVYVYKPRGGHPVLARVLRLSQCLIRACTIMVMIMWSVLPHSDDPSGKYHLTIFKCNNQLLTRDNIVLYRLSPPCTYLISELQRGNKLRKDS